jgi:hypothetical protein|tara:strand:+ start:446 stop:607 length:162 start_codon:yes stop_codon:yes gene_type:complete
MGKASIFSQKFGSISCTGTASASGTNIAICIGETILFVYFGVLADNREERKER